jgi:hypothetical protein
MQIKDIPLFNWKALDKVLHNFREAINTNEPLEGSGIRVTEHTGAGRLIESSSGTSSGGNQKTLDDAPSNGKLYERKDATWTADPSQFTPAVSGFPDGEPAAWHQINLIDASCNKYTMWVWGGTPQASS